MAATVNLLADSLTLSLSDEGSGSAVLLLHAGAGPTSMRPLLRALRGYRVVLPIHPGFDGTSCPVWCRRIADLTLVYLALIERLGLMDVTLVGNRWAAGSPAVARVVIIDGVGLRPTALTGVIVDPGKVPPATLPSLVYANAARFARPPSPESRTAAEAGQRALNRYAGEPFACDPSLPERLATIRIPVQVLWGEADQIVLPAYGRALAAAIPGAGFQLIAGAGHFPQIEQTDAVVDSIRDFISRCRKS